MAFQAPAFQTLQGPAAFQHESPTSITIDRANEADLAVALGQSQARLSRARLLLRTVVGQSSVGLTGVGRSRVLGTTVGQTMTVKPLS